MTAMDLVPPTPKLLYSWPLLENQILSRKLLHGVFRRGGKAEAKQDFEIDYYDMHWLPRWSDFGDRRIWRAGLLGGNRVLSLAKRLSGFRKLRDFSEAKGWQMGQGFIYGRRANPKPADHIYDRRLINPDTLGEGGMIVAEEQFVPRGTAIADVRTPEFFTGPFLLIRKQHDLGHGVIDKRSRSICRQSCRNIWSSVFNNRTVED